MDIEKLRDEAKRALGRKEIECLIGYQAGSYGFRVSAAFLTDKEEVERLIFSPLCALSLVNYLTIEGRQPPASDDKKVKPGKIAIVVRGCDSRAINQLLAEGGLSRDRLYIIGVACSGVIDLKKAEARFPGTMARAEVAEENETYMISIDGQTHTVPRDELLADTCKTCQHPTPLIFDKLVGDKRKGSPACYDDIKALEEKTPEAKREFWQDQLNRCIRCYACRNACPLCYCDGCILDKLKPQWVKRSVDTAENAMFHLTRAFHLAGRCVSCGECERVCPVSIPLMKLNRKMEKDVKELFNFEAGKDPAAQPLLNTFKIEDPDDFVL
jgi:ferredoxin